MSPAGGRLGFRSAPRGCGGALSTGDRSHDLTAGNQGSAPRDYSTGTAVRHRRADVPMRIYALAKDLKIDSKELVDICTRAGIPGKGSALASLEDDEIVKLKTYMEGSAAKKAPSGPAPLVDTRAVLS